MPLTAEQIRHVANLARLELSAQEAETYRSRLSVILQAFEQLAEVDTSGIEPTSHVLAGDAHVRSDVAAPESGLKTALSNAPQVDGASFAIPKVIE